MQRSTDRFRPNYCGSALQLEGQEYNYTSHATFTRDKAAFKFIFFTLTAQCIFFYADAMLSTSHKRGRPIILKIKTIKKFYCPVLIIYFV